MSFHSLLNSIIDSQSVTKNSLINETGIDRSSFYQILSGKRIPTKDQITSIIRQLDISATDEMALYDAFYLERLGETNYHYLKFTEKCLNVIGASGVDAKASSRQILPLSQELKNKLPDNPVDTDRSQAATGTILYHSTDEIICGLTKFLIHASKKKTIIYRYHFRSTCHHGSNCFPTFTHLSLLGNFKMQQFPRYCISKQKIRMTSLKNWTDLPLC